MSVPKSTTLKSMENMDFKNVAEKIHENYEVHEENIKKSCIKSSVVDLDEFYKGLEDEMKKIDAEILPKKIQSTVDDYANLLFKVFEEYPENLEKPKRPTSKDKMSCSIRVGGSSGNLTQSMHMQTTIVQPSKEELEQQNLKIENDVLELPKAIDTLNDFKTFKKKFYKLKTELKDKKLTTEYETILNQLNGFSRQLEKLMPVERISLPAFTAVEEENLKKLANDLEKLNFLQDNKNLFQKTTEHNDDNEYIESLINVLSYAMMAIRGYNENTNIEIL